MSQEALNFQDNAVPNQPAGRNAGALPGNSGEMLGGNAQQICIFLHPPPNQKLLVDQLLIFVNEQQVSLGQIRDIVNPVASLGLDEKDLQVSLEYVGAS